MHLVTVPHLDIIHIDLGLPRSAALQIQDSSQPGRTGFICQDPGLSDTRKQKEPMWSRGSWPEYMVLYTYFCKSSVEGSLNSDDCITVCDNKEVELELTMPCLAARARTHTHARTRTHTFIHQAVWLSNPSL